MALKDEGPIGKEHNRPLTLRNSATPTTPKETETLSDIWE